MASAFPSALAGRELVVFLNISPCFLAASQQEAEKMCRPYPTSCLVGQELLQGVLPAAPRQHTAGDTEEKPRLNTRKNHKAAKIEKMAQRKVIPQPTAEKRIQRQGNGGEGGTSCNT